MVASARTDSSKGMLIDFALAIPQKFQFRLKQLLARHRGMFLVGWSGEPTLLGCSSSGDEEGWVHGKKRVRAAEAEAEAVRKAEAGSGSDALPR